MRNSVATRELTGELLAIDEAVLTSPLYEEIGRLKVELDWLKKKLTSPIELKRHEVGWRAYYSVFVLADGLGGHQAGEKAARFFCHSFIQYATKYGILINNAPIQTVKKWFNDAVAMMADAFQGDPVAYDAYTTCVILIITDAYVISAHCGDSRIYRINPQGIVWRTKDHSIPQKLLDVGELDEHKMGTHPEQNQLTKSINITNQFAAVEAYHSFHASFDSFTQFLTTVQ
jgi:serine/threonine protein phosphatase PrpC